MLKNVITEFISDKFHIFAVYKKDNSLQKQKKNGQIHNYKRKQVYLLSL